MKTKYKQLAILHCLSAFFILGNAFGGPVTLPNHQFELYVEKVLKETHGAGVAIGVVSDGKLSWAKGFGVRNLEKNEPVTPQTVFTIGSISKSFTSTLAGILVDQGKLDWDSPIRKVLPNFQMVYDSSAKNINLVHLLTHQTGMPRHDFLWILNHSLKRNDVLRDLKYLESLPKIGQKFLYNNLMYTIAGIAEEKVTGKKWELLLKEEVFRPLHMNSSSAQFAQLLEQKDHALPYSVDSKDNTVLTTSIIGLDAVGPAGSVNSNIEDMSQYALLHLNGGTLPGSPSLLSPKSYARIHKPEILLERENPISQLLFSKLYPNSDLQYQLGWIEAKRHDLTIWEHSGGTRGYAAQLILVPEKGIGIIVLANADIFPSNFLAHDVLDHLLGKEPQEYALSLKRELKEKLEKNRLAQSGNRPAPVLTPADLQEVAGDYIHEGEIFPFSIVEAKNGLEFIKQDQRIDFVPQGQNLWGLKTEDSILKSFVFQWDSKRNGFYLKFAMDEDSIPRPFFKKKVRMKSNL